MPDERPAIRRRLATVVWTLVVPLAVLAVAIALALSWRGELPDPVASHWGGSGGVDGSASFGATIALLPAIVVPFSLFMWGVGMFAGRTAAARRFAAFFAVWFAVSMSGIIVGSLAIQRGLDDWHQAGGIGAVLAIAFGAATVLGAVAAAAMPGDAHQPTTAPVPAGALRAPLAGTAGATWTRTVGAGPLRWTVTVDRHGLTARGVLPWPRTVVPLDEVEVAEAVTADPLREFGGWGYRIGSHGRVGIVLRKGDAILVRRTGGRELVVTVDDAARGAALLNTLAERTRAR